MLFFKSLNLDFHHHRYHTVVRHPPLDTDFYDSFGIGQLSSGVIFHFFFIFQKLQSIISIQINLIFFFYKIRITSE